MKYVVILGDGMADRPFEGFGGKTALECAKKPTIDYLASNGILGMAKTVPDHMPAGSDTANISVMGYDPEKYYSGRSPFEAFSIGVPMKDTDISFRCNIVTLKGEGAYEDLEIIDHGADEISTEEASILIKAVSEALSTEELHFYTGVSYRHILLWNNGPYDWTLVPPHDILGKRVGDYLPKGEKSQLIENMMRKSYEILKNHEINQKRIARGLNPGNSIWIWGEGKKPLLSSFKDKYGLKGSVISAVDLIKGIGLCAGMDSINVEGATGNVHTNYDGKAQAAIQALESGQDFVYVHIEAPDECSHRFEPENKIKAIELIDEKIVKPIKAALDKSGEPYRLMVVPDHPTPLELRTHTHDAVPFMIFDSAMPTATNQRVSYSERSGASTGLYFQKGYQLMDYFLEKPNRVKKYISTRNKSIEATASEAILNGISEDGGLYVPVNIPKIEMPLGALLSLDYKKMAYEIMKLYLSDFTPDELVSAIEKAYDEKFDTKEIAPLILKNGVGILELFHGPTLAFKDMALSILPHLLTTSAKKQGLKEEIVILTATSGDTGKAALEGFADVPGTSIIVFFPESGVSEVQKKQMTTQLGKNTYVIGIHGNFDDAQNGVKKMFTDKKLKEKLEVGGKVFSSANSINIGRLIPQVVYYFYAYKQAVEAGYILEGESLNYTVPTGNFGNILAGYYAKKMGLPIGKLICASNQNKVLYDFIKTGIYDANREFTLTSSPSMDILISSNLERLLYHLAEESFSENPSVSTEETISGMMKDLKHRRYYEITAEMKTHMEDFLCGYADEKKTETGILEMYKNGDYIMDTHTAVAYSVYRDLVTEESISEKNIILSTASPYKFATDVLKPITALDSKLSISALFNKMSEYGKLPIPRSIQNLEDAPILHKTVCQKNEMQTWVEKILKL